MTKKRVLVVDDEPSVRELLGYLLDTFGYAWETACDADQALGMLEHTPFDLVLTDFKMPGMNGVELAHEIKKRKKGMRVVLITGEQPQNLTKDIDWVLLKPIVVQELRETIDLFARKRRSPQGSSAEGQYDTPQPALPPSATKRLPPS